MATAPPPRRSILLVQDDVRAATALRSVLAQRGFRVSSARSGDEGLELLALAREPHLVLLDAALPDMTGVEFGRRLRGLVAAPPVVLISGAEARLEEAARSLNAVGTLRRPFDASELLTCIDEVLRAESA